MNVKPPCYEIARIFLTLCLLFIVSTLTSAAAAAATVTLRWDPNTPSPQGYRVFARRGDQVFNYSHPDWEGTAVSCTISNLEDQTDHYFVVRAFDGTLESDDSAEVHYIPPASFADTQPPSWDGATWGIGSASNITGGNVTVEFDTARDGVDGSNLRFNVYYAANGSWNHADWTRNSVITDAAVFAGQTFTHAVTASGLADDIGYTFGVRVEDRSGNEDANDNTLRVAPAASLGDTVIDNRASQTVATGSWWISNGSDPYDDDSYFSRDGSTFSWYFRPLQSGDYEVFMWWTKRSSRSTRVPVRIAHSNGTDTLYIDQQVNGGRWNSQGRYYFESGKNYGITITAQPGPSSTCADAVRFQRITDK